MDQAKEVKLVFPDYKIENENLANALISNVNLYKKTNTLEIFLQIKELISIVEIEKISNYIIKRFQVTIVNFKIENQKSENEINEFIKNDWENILGSISTKLPIIKAFMKNSEIEIEKSTITINIKIKGIEILKNQRIDEYISNLVKDIYGAKFKIEFKETDIANTQKILDDENERIVKNFVEASKNAQANNANRAENVEPVQEKSFNKFQYNNDNNFQPKNNFRQKREEEEDTGNPNAVYGRTINANVAITKLEDIGVEPEDVVIQGEVVSVPEATELKKSGKFLQKFDVYDGTNTLTCKAFLTAEKKDKVLKKLKEGAGIKVKGKSGYDNFEREITIMADSINTVQLPNKNERMDTATEKRVELHMHTQMSQMDGIASATDLINRARKWGMKSIAITDHAGCQAFPDAHHLMQKIGYDSDFKVLYGVEGYLALDQENSIFGSRGQKIEDCTFCVLDLETTGFSYRTEKITEIGIMKVKNGEIIEEFDELVDPEKPIPEQVVEVTHITDDMVKGKPTIDKMLPKALEFIGDSIVVTHNTNFDIGWIKYNCEQLGYKFNNTYLDTLRLSKQLYPNYKNYKLGTIAANLKIEVDVAHRALADVDTTVKVLNVMLDEIKEKGAKTLDDIDIMFKGNNWKKTNQFHVNLLVKDYVGLRNLYKLISYSNIKYFYRKPLILKSILNQYSEGLLIGSGCDQGELYQAYLSGKSEDEIEEIAKFYDYLEVQPVENKDYFIKDGTLKSKEDLQNIIRKIVALGEKLDKPVCATGDVHFLDPQDEIYRRILKETSPNRKMMRDYEVEGALYFRTTDEMLESFSFLGEEKAYEIVVKNTNMVSDMCEKISPISPEKCPPYIPGCEKTIEEIAYKRAHELYGEELPEIVENRLKKELDSIIKNGFSVMYIIAQKLVWKSNEDGYIVGSRGSVGSSFVANMTGITEVNSLPPHYRCSKCKYSDFTNYGVLNGFDLPDKNCPKCGTSMQKDGMDIPFETFLGFNGDKEPDIDLNFSGDYQAKAHKYTEVIFGKGTTFKAGTVGTVADKTAFGYVKKYYEENHVPKSNAEVNRIAKGCTGIKRTTGQHPGGIIVVPKGREIYEFTPVQHPADDANSDIVTTHFDYHSIDQNLLKLDILGHDDPTVIRMLYDLTGFDPTKVPLDDEVTMSIYSSTKALGVTEEQIHSEVGTYGIPESGTKFVRGMLKDTKPTTFEELIRISGLSHGTDVWLGNAQDLINSGTAKLNETICTRDEIMLTLMKKGLPPNTAFKIMELVRKGKVAKEPEKWADYKKVMQEHNVPDWYIDSCNKIKYLFPKAHAAAYVTNAFRIAWFKVHIPKAYYTAYYTIRADAFDSEVMCHGHERVKNKMKEIELLGNAATQKDKDMYETLELVNEMYYRGINFLPIDLYKSGATRFKMEDEGIRPPLNSIPGFGGVAANGIEEARKDGEFMCIDDLKIRAKLGNSGIEMLREAGCLEGMSQSNQISLFG